MTKGSTRRKTKKHGFSVFIILLAILAGVGIGGKYLLDHGMGEKLPSLFGSGQSGSGTPASPMADEPSLREAVRALAQKDSRAQVVYENFNDYPQPIIKLLVNNPDARDFVYDYPSHINNPQTGKLTAYEGSMGIPLLLQWDQRWGYTQYGSGVLGITGCGPTCLSMVAVGLTGNSSFTPNAVAENSLNQGFYVDGAGSSWDLMRSGLETYGLAAEELPLSEDLMISKLEQGHPIIANVGVGDFTDSGHFIVITGYKDGMFTVNDPNSPSRSAEGWYYATLSSQIMNLWAYSLV